MNWPITVEGDMIEIGKEYETREYGNCIVESIHSMSIGGWNVVLGIFYIRDKQRSTFYFCDGYLDANRHQGELDIMRLHNFVPSIRGIKAGLAKLKGLESC